MLSRQGGSAGPSHLQALPLQAWQGEEDPPATLGLGSPSKQESEVFVGIHWGGPSPKMLTLSQCANSKAEGYPGEQFWQQEGMEKQEAGHFGISKADT